jgi:parallel beta-helix repeat protein
VRSYWLVGAGWLAIAACGDDAHKDDAGPTGGGFGGSSAAGPMDAATSMDARTGAPDSDAQTKEDATTGQDAALDAGIADAGDDAALNMDAGPPLVFGGVFEVSDAYCVPCQAANSETGTCTCPAGFAAQTFRILNDCAGVHGANASVCHPPSAPAADYAGGYQLDDSGATCEQGCRSPNPYTGMCSCPAGTTPISTRTLADTPCANLVGSHIVFCARSEAAYVDFGGAYQNDDAVGTGLGCRTPNPLAGSACACPAGTVAETLRVVADGNGGNVGSTIGVCRAPAPAFPTSAEICAGVSVDLTGATDASAGLQQCVNATPSGGTLEIPAGVYRMNGQLSITQAITLRTQGTNGAPPCLGLATRCAVLRAAPDLYAVSGILKVASTSGVTVDHVILDGNREARLGTMAADDCITFANNRATAFNAQFIACTNCAFTNGGSINALCGTALGWDGDGASIQGNTIRDNGDHSNRVCDGITVGSSANVNVFDNLIVDATDIGIILGNAPGGTIAGNAVIQHVRVGYAGLMIDNFNNSTAGNFDGFSMSGNTVDCNLLCDFGIQVGPHPWYLSAHISGGTVTGNAIRNAPIGVNIDGAGSPNAVHVYANGITGVPANHMFSCGVRPGAAINIGPDATVDRHGETGNNTATEWHLCY